MTRRRTLGSFGILAVLWLLLSGHYTPVLLSLGALSAGLVAWLAARMGLLPRTSVLRLVPGAARYAPYLLLQIVRSSVDVVRRILDPRLPIAPRIVTVRASQPSDALRVVYANSVTLTPGTVTVELAGDQLRVHALSAESAGDLQAGTLDRHVAAVDRA